MKEIEAVRLVNKMCVDGKKRRGWQKKIGQEKVGGLMADDMRKVELCKDDAIQIQIDRVKLKYRTKVDNPN